MLHGDLGISIFTNLPVTHLIGQRIEPTLSLMLLTLVLAIVVAVPLGVRRGLEGGQLDRPRRHGRSRCSASRCRCSCVGYVLAYVFALELDWLPVQGYTPIARGLLAVAAQPDPAGVALGLRLHRADRAHHARHHARGAAAGLHPHRAGQGRWRSGAILFVHALKNAAVPIVTVIGIGIALLIGGAVVTESVFAIPGPRPADRRCDPAPRLSGHPGRHAAVQLRLRAGQSAGRSDLHALRPEDPLLTRSTRPSRVAARRRRRADLPDAAAAGASARRGVAASCAAIRPSPSAARCCCCMVADRRSSRRCLGTVDPTALAPVTAHAAALGGVLVRHRHARPRRLFSRVRLRRAGLADRRLRGGGPRIAASGWRSGSSPASCAGLDGDRHAHHGRADVDPADPARDRADGADPRQRRQRHPRDHHRRDPARRAAGAQRRADPARAALCRGGGRVRHAHAAIILAPHPAQHAGAADRAGDLYLRLGDDHRGDPVVHRRRHAAEHPVLGQHHGRGPRAVAGQALSSSSSRPCSCRSRCSR